MILSESDVRAHVRDVANGTARWIEPSLGSTIGLPDCWVPKQGVCVHIELKCGVLKNSELRYEVRPEQKKQLQLMKQDKVPCGLLIGVEGTEILIAARIDRESLSGRLKLEKNGEEKWMSVMPHNTLDWRRTVDFFLKENVSGSKQNGG